jgi:hypothetical protein
MRVIPPDNPINTHDPGGVAEPLDPYINTTVFSLKDSHPLPPPRRHLPPDHNPLSQRKANFLM